MFTIKTAILREGDAHKCISFFLFLPKSVIDCSALMTDLGKAKGVDKPFHQRLVAINRGPATLTFNLRLSRN